MLGSAQVEKVLGIIAVPPPKKVLGVIIGWRRRCVKVVVVVVVVVEILRLHVLKVHPKPGPFHRVIWAMKPRQCISVQFSDVHPISEWKRNRKRPRSDRKEKRQKKRLTLKTNTLPNVLTP